MSLRLAVLASGSGRSLQNLIDRAADGRLAATPVVVGLSRPGLGAAERAARAGLPSFVRRKRRARSSADYSRRVFDELRRFEPDLVCLARFLQRLVIPPDFEQRVLNIHPALIPAFCGQGFYGQRVHEAVWRAGVKVSGCTVHFCDNIYDHGPIIVQRAVALHPHDDTAAIARRVFAAELEAYPTAINLIARRRVSVVDGRCEIRPG